jgi:hypothetical protein
MSQAWARSSLWRARCNRPADAGPDTVSPLSNLADHVPVSESRACSRSDSCAVPCPERGSLTSPDQLEAGNATDGVVGPLGAPLPRQPTLNITTTIGARQRLARRSARRGGLGAQGVWCSWSRPMLSANSPGAVPIPSPARRRILAGRPLQGVFLDEGAPSPDRPAITPVHLFSAAAQFSTSVTGSGVFWLLTGIAARMRWPSAETS